VRVEVLRVRPVVACYPKLYSWWQARGDFIWGAAKKLLDELSSYIKPREGERVELLDPVLVSSLEELYSHEVRGRIVAGADAILAVNGGAGSQPVLVGLGDLGLPMVIVGLTTLGVEDKEREGVPGPEALDAYGELRRGGVPVILAVSYGDVVRGLRVARCLKALKATRIVAFGTPASYIKDVVTPLEFLERRLGLEVRVVPLDRLVSVYEGIDPSSAEVREVVERVRGKASGVARFVEEAGEALRDAARLYLAMRRILEEEGGTATAVDCFGFMDLIFRKHKTLRPPCIALSLLRSEGVPAACEADMDALVTMIIMSSISGQPAFMGNPTYMSPSKGIIRISHCTIPLEMVESYELVSFHESGYGATIRGYMRVGETVTFARLSKRLERMVIARGRIVRSRIKGPLECATRVEIEVGDVDRFVEVVEGDHHVVVYGDWTRELERACRILGITPIVIT